MVLTNITWRSARGNKRLAAAFANVTKSLGMPLLAVNVEQVARDDSLSFRDRKIPVISIHSVTQETFPILHSVRDQAAAIRMDDYYATYRLITAYLAFLGVFLD